MTAVMDEAGVRPYRIYDGDGAFVGDFAAWLPAHRWAHQRAGEPGARLPVEIEDRARLYVEQVWPDRCQTLHFASPAVIPTCPLAGVAEPTLHVRPGGLAADATGDRTPGADGDRIRSRRGGR